LLGEGIRTYDDDDFPFNLSAHTCLKKLSIFTEIDSFSVEDDNEIKIESSLLAIIRLIATSSSVQHVTLSVYFKVSDISRWPIRLRLVAFRSSPFSRYPTPLVSSSTSEVKD